MQQFGSAGQADPGVDAGADRSGQQGVAVSRSPFILVGFDHVEVRRDLA
jgi:hypothetical protein